MPPSSASQHLDVLFSSNDTLQLGCKAGLCSSLLSGSCLVSGKNRKLNSLIINDIDN